MSSTVVNELLCYVQNNFPKHPRTLVGVAINGFYSDDEVSAAKLCLHDIIEALKIDSMPRFIRRQASDNKRKLECEDIMSLFTFVDNVKCQLPTFVAANLQRIPSVSPGDVDVYAMAANVSSLSAQLEVLTKKVATLSQDNATHVLQSVNERLDAFEAKVLQNGFPALSSLPSTVSRPLPVSADIHVSGDVSYAKCVAMPPQASKKQPIIRVKGTANQTRVKAVPRDPPANLLKAFVGRMDIDTTEEDLKTCLNDAGLKVVHCRRLKPPGDKIFKTAAFYVACDEVCKDLFYNEETWPEGAELRDWYTSS
jgi:hypothetical protein